ncbi:hypothetical protein [Flagellimonas lutimaris]|uniref:hypothetical protein n=1 Tax=Flagellimonas lutimaris TaxID=475082 RepID=UPI003F5CF28D
MKNLFVMVVFGILSLLGCRERNPTNNQISTKEIELSQRKEKNDFHPLIDLILDKVHPEEQKRYNLIVSIDSTVIPRLTRFPPDFEKRLGDSVKINLLKDFQARTDEFELNTEKLNQKSRKLLNQRKGVENKIQIVFNGFLESARGGLAVTSVGFYYSPKGGWEEIIIFKKNFEEWKLTDRIKTVYY